MTKETEQLQRVGVALFGPSWQTPLANALGVAVRTVQRWAAGASNMPPSVWLDIAKLCRSRGGKLIEWAERLAREGK